MTTSLVALIGILLTVLILIKMIRTDSVEFVENFCQYEEYGYNIYVFKNPLSRDMMYSKDPRGIDLIKIKHKIEAFLKVHSDKVWNVDILCDDEEGVKFVLSSDPFIKTCTPKDNIQYGDSSFIVLRYNQILVLQVDDSIGTGKNEMLTTMGIFMAHCLGNYLRYIK